MRILAIRGQNLASLADKFELKLEEGALANVGLFAITGATGSGKSTILDALCLALYDAIPRLPRGSSHSVAIRHKDEEESMAFKSNEVGSILRRGTAYAYAEVDFVGRNTRRYQARWEISRARGKVNGRLQAQKISLRNLDTLDFIGDGKKKETLEAIELAIGLNFEQFRRSVLLAQGDFAAFLKAKKDERSYLLEKMTGTAIYTELSVAAFQRAKHERQILEKITDQLADKIPLATQERAILELQQQQLLTQFQQLNTEIQATQTLLAWFKTETELKQHEQQAQAIVDTLQQDWDHSQQQRADLQKIEQVQILRPLVEQLTYLQGELLEAQTQLQQDNQRLKQAEQQRKPLKSQLILAEQHYVVSVNNGKEAQPQLQQARELDTQIKAGLLTQTELETQVNQQKNQHQGIWQHCQQLVKQQTDNHGIQQQHTRWLEQHMAIAAVADQWQRWEKDINDYINQQQTLAHLDKDKQQLQTDIVASQQYLSDIHASAAEELVTSQQLNQSINALKQQWNVNGFTDIQRDRERYQQQLQQLQHGIEFIHTSLLLRHDLAQAQQQLAKILQEMSQLDVYLPTLQQQLAHKDIQLNTAQYSFNLIQAAGEQAAQQLRGLLQPNQACPVCGSEQHPWENSDVVIPNHLLLEQQQRLQQLHEDRDQLITEQSQKKSDKNQLIKEQQRLITHLQTMTAEQQQLAENWTLIRRDHSLEWFALQDTDQLHYQQQFEQLDATYLALKQAEQQWINWQEQLAVIIKKQQYDSEKRQGVDKQLAIQQTQWSAVTYQGSELLIAQAKLMDVLTTPFQAIDHWQTQLNQQGQSFLHTIQQQVLQWQQTQAELIRIESQSTELITKIAIATAEQQQAEQLLVKYTDALAQIKQKNQGFIDKRNSYFEGGSADHYTEQLEAQLQQTERNKDALQTQLELTTADTIRYQSRVVQWQVEQQRRAINQDNVRIKLDHALLEQQLNKVDLESLLTKDKQWIEAENQRYTDLYTKLQQVITLLNAKTATLITHQQMLPTIEQSCLRSQYDTLQQSQQSLQQQQADNDFKLRTDDEKLKLSDTLLHSLNRQRACWEKWEGLSSLIGSNTGSTFRNFAQSVTLDNLLAYANKHLHEFSQRYYLERVFNGGLELQVIDRDMADDVRSIHSLSGGESFLVSLALALGLASLSSNKIQVESLFIDEGFGSLDSETLDIAIASLDTLQSLGRKVGVISHVPILVERIGAKVVVEKMGGGQSRVSVCAF